MLGKIFSSNKDPDKDLAKGAASAKAGEAAPRAPVDRALWEARLAAAQGDDAALLALANEAPLVDIKVAAIAAMTGEDALKQAELAFRDHHRRAHREAKQRLERAQWTRKTRDKAESVIADAGQLRAQAELPANKLVELDRAWSALDQTVLLPEQVERYAADWQALSKGMRARGDLLVQTTRWAAAVQGVVAQARRAARDVVHGDAAAATLDAPRDALAQCLADAPSGDAALEDEDLRSTALQWLATLAAIAERTAYLDATAASANADAAAWEALPAVPDAALARPLQERFADRQREAKRREDEASARNADSERVARKALDQARRDQLAGLIAKAEAQLAEGHVQDAVAVLREIDATQAGHAPDRKLSGRIQKLHGQVGQLNKWKQWGGGRAREDLVAEAQALEAAAAQPKLHLRGHAEAIDKLRERWKELDKLGGAGNREMWQTFDGALKRAHEPVEAFQKKLKEQRDENLKKRQALIAGLDAVVLPAGEGAEAPDYKALARALDHLDSEWRKLGPIEHTVPKKALPALLAKLAAAKARLEAPLADARRVEALRREKLIASAKALDPKSRDAVTKTRDLQAQWQTHAKAMPLAREAENALWRQFKDALDAVFKARDAEHKARETEWSGNAKVRQELIHRLRDLGPEHAPEAIRRTVSEVENAWRKAGEPQRAEAGKLEAQYRAAKDAAKRLLEGSATREWHATCDALAARLAFLRDVEAGTRLKSEDEWQSMRALPGVWQKALSDRFAGSAAAADALHLLRLEDALDIPSPPSQSGARRDLKLRAMKAAMEGRVAVAAGDADIAGWLAALLRDPGLAAEERQRLDKVIESVRRRALRF